MLEYAKIDISEEIDLNKSGGGGGGQKSVIFYEPYLGNGCHDLMQKAMNFNDVAIVSIKGSDYKIYFWYMSKSNAINLLNNSVLDNKGVL